MTRKKVNLSYISKPSTRKTTYTKRMKGFGTKFNELTVLCDIDACAVIYSPYNSQPVVLPSPIEVRSVIERFEALTETEQERKMMNHESFLKESISKQETNIDKRSRENREIGVKEAMYLCLQGKGHTLNLTHEECVDLYKCMDQFLNELYKRRSEMRQNSHFESGESSSTRARATDQEQGHNPMMTSAGCYNQHPNINQDQYQQHYPIAAEEGLDNSTQNQNQSH